MSAQKWLTACAWNSGQKHGFSPNPVQRRSNPRDQRLESCSSHVTLNSPRQMGVCVSSSPTRCETQEASTTDATVLPSALTWRRTAKLHAALNDSFSLNTNNYTENDSSAPKGFLISLLWYKDKATDLCFCRRRASLPPRWWMWNQTCPDLRAEIFLRILFVSSHLSMVADHYGTSCIKGDLKA